jgi:LAO/AO transport system kinase
MALAEAAGFDIVIVETVGVGQSETAVADMVDVFVVLLLAGAGDELQGIKRGVIELADIVAITKVDGDNVERAKRAAGELQSALNIISPPSRHWRPRVLTLSAQQNQGLDALWEAIAEHRRTMSESGELEARRRQQNVAWMRQLLADGLMSLVLGEASVEKRLRVLEQQVAAGTLTAPAAVAEIVKLVAGRTRGARAR